MRKLTIITFLTIGTFLSSCTNAQTTDAPAQGTEQKSEAVIENVSVDQFATLIKEGKGTLLDVRTPGENAAGNIEGSLLIDVNGGNFDAEIQKLDKNAPVYVYCRSGARSMNAAKKMEAQGFTKIYNLDGGFMAWSRK